ncbi:UDP-glucose 4-epimerase GalE [Putridiphycobacter roseus]|uniref:UDP-glucose 4-epimerase n=1 Tax=Putridiphycobacter roseus TaxID=2219161 RepID=A0A2W1N5J5_9FLAO|nr:UDP-glucose 4-epimerase GalE [Putridiphycobacter roseus]PZE18860.1 UDP-glucose 4-epimerase GalE [Putridiphycobacter roseus]
MEEILVTGGTGYIGSHTVVELIESGYKPIIVDDFRNSKPFILDRLAEITGEEITQYKLDCADEEALSEVFEKHPNIAGVIHFAADKAVGESAINPLKYYDNNIGGLVTVLKVLLKFKVQHFVFSSSCTVYGEPESPVVIESTPIQNAASPYGDTKIICERIIQNTVQANPNFNATLLRYFNPIGAHPSALIGELPQGIPNNLVPYITQTANGIRESLTVYGDDYPTEDGTCIRDYIHVVDLAKAHVNAIKWLSNEPAGVVEAFNIGTGKGSSVLEIIRTFEAVNQLKIKYAIGPKRAGDVIQIYANPTKAKTVLNWTAKYTIADALKHSWNWEKSLLTLK